MNSCKLLKLKHYLWGTQRRPKLVDLQEICIWYGYDSHFQRELIVCRGKPRVNVSWHQRKTTLIILQNSILELAHESPSIGLVNVKSSLWSSVLISTLLLKPTKFSHWDLCSQVRDSLNDLDTLVEHSPGEVAISPTLFIDDSAIVITTIGVFDFLFFFSSSYLWKYVRNLNLDARQNQRSKETSANLGKSQNPSANT